MQGTDTALVQATPASGADLESGVATLRLVLSPIPDACGHYRMVHETVPAGQPVRAYLPRFQACHASINGGVVRPSDYDTRRLAAGEELLLKPAVHIAEGVAAVLIQIAIGIAISVATALIFRAIFPPARPKFAEQDDPTFGFEGIRSTVGPGAKVPIIYGRHRIGGQFLQASVEAGHALLLTLGETIHYPQQEVNTVLHVQLGLGEGPLQEIETATVELNGQPLSNFPDVTTDVRFGTPDQSAMARFSESRNSFADGREITSFGILYTTTTDITAYQLTISFDEGLVRFTSKGEKITNKVLVQFRHRVAGTLPWNLASTVVVEHDKTTVVRVGVRSTPLPLETYDIEVTFISASSTAENARWRPFLESVMEIQAGTETYPNTALLGLTAVATENLSGTIPNITLVVKGRTVRVGSFAVSPTWSQNPAWCLMDYLTNTRYGLAIPDGEINLFSFLAFAAYCDQLIDGEPRHTLDTVITEDAEEAINHILAGCRGTLYKLQGQWTLLPLRDEPPVQLLSWTNCANVKLSYGRDPDRITVMEGRFADQLEAWETSVMTWPIEANWPAQIRKTTVDLRGVTRRSAVQRALQYELNRRTIPKVQLTMDCALEALALTVNDIFRFSHPLPGWGVSGRIQPGSTTTTIVLDETVTFEAGKVYHLYVRQSDDSVETKAVVHPGSGPAQRVTLTTPLLQTPTPMTSLYAFGESTPLDTAIREFRVTKLERLTDNTLRISAAQHNPSIYDDPTAEPLPVISTLFNPLGPPPALTSFVLLEMPRVGPDGRSRVVANLSWDVLPLSAGFAPYGGAIIYRREVSISSLAGTGVMGEVALAEIQSTGDAATTEFLRIATVGALRLDYDDPLVITGITYGYKVVPISTRGVPNNAGAVTGILHIAGPTTPEFFPGTVENLRLLGGGTLFEGRDVHLLWDRLISPLFTETFFLKEYVVEVWAPEQAYLMRRTTTTVENYTYTYEMNAEDQAKAGMGSARRDLLFLVRGRTNTDRESLVSAQLAVSNPPPDMSSFLPVCTPIFAAILIDWTFYLEPRDLDHYDVKFEASTPPNASLSTISASLRKVAAQGLTPGVTYYVQIVPYDTFGIGIPTGIAAAVPLSLTVFELDTTPPGTPTGLAVTTAYSINPDGTIVSVVEASWAPNPEPDLSGYQVNFRFGETLSSPTVMNVDASQTTVRLDGVPGNVNVYVKIAAHDTFRNFSDFTPEVSVLTAADTAPPVAPTSLSARGFFRAHVLSWQPPADLDLSTMEIWASSVNNRDAPGLFKVAEVPGTDAFFQHGPLDASNVPADLGTAMLGAATGANTQTYTLYYWLRAKDTSGNVSAFHPLSPTAGIGATSLLLSGDNIVQTDALITTGAQIGNALITDAHIQNLSAAKLLAGTVQVLLRLGVGNIELDAPNNIIRIRNSLGVVTVELGLLDALRPASQNYGIRIYDPRGVVLFDASQEGVTANAIRAGLIQAGHIAAHVLTAVHMRTDIAVITVAAQIANALIDTAHIKAAAIQTALIADAAITSAKIASAAITSAHIGTAQIASAMIQDAAITTAKIGLGQIQTAHIGDAQITSAKIGNLEVDNAKIANLTIGTGKIQDQAVSAVVRSISASAVINVNTEQGIMSITVPDIPGGSVAVLSYTGTIVAGAPNNLTNEYTFRIREDSLSGTVLATLTNLSQAGHPSMFVAIQAAWDGVPGDLASKTWVVSAQRLNVPPAGDQYHAQGHLIVQVHKK